MASHRFVGLALTLACALFGCGVSGEANDVEASGDDLVNGTVAKKGEFRSAVHIQDSCTAALVGPRHILLAAHCVLDLEIGRPPAPSTAVESLRSDLDMAYGGQKGVGTFSLSFSVSKRIVERGNRAVHVPPKTLQACRSGHCYFRKDEAEEGSLLSRTLPDIAILELETPVTADLAPPAPIDLRPLRVGSSVTLIGYGCTGKESDKAGILRTAKSEIMIPTPESVGIGNRYAPKDLWGEVVRTNTFTAGAALLPGAPGLCSGDSGGPLLRDGAVVGVASDRLYRKDTDYSNPLVNLFTRLDRDSSADIASWLKRTLPDTVFIE